MAAETKQLAVLKEQLKDAQSGADAKLAAWKEAHPFVREVLSGVGCCDLFETTVLLHPKVDKRNEIPGGVVACIGQVEFFDPFGAFEYDPLRCQEQVALCHRLYGAGTC